MTVEQLREWLRQWVIKTTGLPAEEITDDKPMQSFGLSSRDVVILSGELENLLDKQLDATIAYQYPTIQALAQQLLAGGPGLGAQGERAGAAHNSRTAHATSATDPSVHDIAVWAWPPATRVPPTLPKCGDSSLKAGTALARCPLAAGRNTPTIPS